jgi:hypothetical protein
MVTIAVNIMLFANFLALFFMWMCGNTSNIKSRTERELELLKEEHKDKN